MIDRYEALKVISRKYSRYLEGSKLWWFQMILEQIEYNRASVLNLWIGIAHGMSTIDTHQAAVNSSVRALRPQARMLGTPTDFTLGHTVNWLFCRPRLLMSESFSQSRATLMAARVSHLTTPRSLGPKMFSETSAATITSWSRHQIRSVKEIPCQQGGPTSWPPFGPSCAS